MAFRRPDIIRPPSERKSYFLPLTGGCSNNGCVFCGYHGSPLFIRDADEVKSEIDALALYTASRITLPGIPRIVYDIARGWDGKRVFLQDGDALVYPFPRLLAVLRHLNEKVPSLERVATYATAQDILRRSVTELERLRELKLGILYMGLESGSDGVLKRVAKGVDSGQIIAAGRRVKEAGVRLSVTVILGLGETGGSAEHALATAQALSAIDPDFVGALTLTLVPGTPLFDDWQKGKFVPISPFASLRELKMIIENARFTNCFFSSMHASNYFSVRGRLPERHEDMVRDLEYVLKQGDPSLLRPEFMRGL